MLDEINKVACMDNLEYMKTLPNESISLIYGDILYGTGRKFKDYQDLKPIKSVIDEFYISRIKEMYRLLKQTGSIYLQCDSRINHWIRCIMDDIFGYENFQNEIVWCYKSQGFNKNKYSSKHDYIIFYSKSKDFTFNMDDIRGEPSESWVKRYSKELKEKGFFTDYKSKKKYYSFVGSPPLDWINISILPSAHKENTGYATQKPLELMDRIIRGSSNEGDVVADFFMGSGGFLVKAKELKRNYIGCDNNIEAVEITNKRLEI